MKNKITLFVMLALALVIPSLLGGGCYCWPSVKENQAGVVLNDGVSISKVLPPGRYGANWRYWADFQTVDCQAKIIEWEDPSLVTRDKQPISFRVAATVRRDCTENGIRNMYRNYNSAARNDDAMALIVTSRMPDAAKAITTRFTLDQMLGTTDITTGTTTVVGEYARVILGNTFHESLQEQLRNENDDTSIVVEAVNINDIGPSQRYLSALDEKSDQQIQTEIAKEKTERLKEEVKQEVEQTNKDLEIARRQNLINEELSKAYELSDRYYELERLKALADVIGGSDKIYFVPEGTDLTLFLGNQNVVPVE